jgi:hypothetical protein
MSKRKFVSIDEDTVETYRTPKQAPKTLYANSSAENALIAFFNSTPCNSSSVPFHKLDSTNLNSLLERFYISCRTVEGKQYKASSFRALRQSLCRSIRLSHKLEIITDPLFHSSNTVFNNRLKDLKQDGLGSIDHHSDISQSDLHKILETLSPNDPEQLQLLTWFLIQLHFCRRGLENAATLHKDHFVIKIIDGKRHLLQAKDEMTKNHRQNDTSRANGAIVPEKSHSKCPVQLFEKYLSKLDPKSPFLWQLPRRQVNMENNASMWYERKAGVHTISNYMKKISQICNLSMAYTNHCIRATTCTLLGKLHSDINVQAISGHKSLSGLSHYKRVDNEQKITMSETLSQFYSPSLSAINPPAISTTPTSNITSDSNLHSDCCISFGVESTSSIVDKVGNDADFFLHDIDLNDFIMETYSPTTDKAIVTVPSEEDRQIIKASGDSAEKVHLYRLFNNCNNCSISNITINFPQQN